MYRALRLAYLVPACLRQSCCTQCLWLRSSSPSWSSLFIMTSLQAVDDALYLLEQPQRNHVVSAII